MSSLNITPNPKAVAVLLAIFLVNIFIIKKLILDSFLKLKKKRDELTSGSLEESQKIDAENEELSNTIEKRKKQAILEAQSVSDRIIQEAAKTQDEISMKAKSEANILLNDIRAGIQKDLAEQRKGIEGKARQLSELFYNKILKS